MAAALGLFSQQRFEWKLLIFFFINIVVKSQRLRALPPTYRQRYARSCMLTLAHSYWALPKEVIILVLFYFFFVLKNVIDSIHKRNISGHVEYSRDESSDLARYTEALFQPKKSRFQR